MAFTTKEGTSVPQLEIKPSHIVDRTNTLYGPSGTGKTVVVRNFLKVIRGHVPEGCVVSPSEPANKSYAGIFPDPLIHYSMSLPPDPNKKNDPLHTGKDTPQKRALRFLNSIYQRQEMKASVYKKANRVAVLAKLYRRLPHAERRRNDPYIKSLARKQKRVASDIHRRHRDEEGICANKIEQAKERFEEMLVLFYKKFITPHVATLWTKKDLGEDERFSLTYLHFNPRFVVVFDDCASEIKAIAKNPLFEPFFYRNRHVFLTVILCCQDDTDLPANLRKNSFVSIFTHENVVTAFFERRANSFPKTVRDLVMKDIGPACFEKKFRQFAYIREDPARLNYYNFTAEFPRPFTFGTPALLELCADLKTDDTQLDTDNPYYARFRT